MLDRLAFLAVLLAVAGALGAMLRREWQEGAAAERARIDAENRARLQRQNEVANRPVSDDELQKRLREGNF